MLFDGDCRFCRLWIERWRNTTHGEVDFLALQEPQVAERFSELQRPALEHAAHLIEPDGRVSSGAEAVFRSLAYNPHEKWLLDWYEHSPRFVQITEWAYRFVARHRPFFSFLTWLGWGNRVERPSHKLV
jgi:predicted DCC family thiol-disulfide oxidoreductase YuxK